LISAAALRNLCAAQEAEAEIAALQNGAVKYKNHFKAARAAALPLLMKLNFRWLNFLWRAKPHFRKISA